MTKLQHETSSLFEDTVQRPTSSDSLSKIEDAWCYEMAAPYNTPLLLFLVFDIKSVVEASLLGQRLEISSFNLPSLLATLSLVAG